MTDLLSSQDQHFTTRIQDYFSWNKQDYQKDLIADNSQVTLKNANEIAENFEMKR